MSLFGGHTDNDDCLHCAMKSGNESERIEKLTQKMQTIDANPTVINEWLSDIITTQKQFSTQDPIMTKMMMNEFISAGLLPLLFRVIDRYVSEESLVEANNQHLLYANVDQALQLLTLIMKEYYYVPEDVIQREEHIAGLPILPTVHKLLNQFRGGVDHEQIPSILFHTIQYLITLIYKSGFVDQIRDNSSQLIAELIRFLPWIETVAFEYHAVDGFGKRLRAMIVESVLIALTGLLTAVSVEIYTDQCDALFPIIFKHFESLVDREYPQSRTLELSCEVLANVFTLPDNMVAPYATAKLKSWEGYTLLQKHPTIVPNVVTLLCRLREITNYHNFARMECQLYNEEEAKQAAYSLFRSEHYLLISIANISNLLKVDQYIFADDTDVISELFMDAIYSNLDHDKFGRSEQLFDRPVEKRRIVISSGVQVLRPVVIHATLRACLQITLMNLIQYNQDCKVNLSAFVSELRKLGLIISTDMEQQADSAFAKESDVDKAQMLYRLALTTLTEADRDACHRVKQKLGVWIC